MRINCCFLNYFRPQLLHMKHKEASPSLSLALTLFCSPTALMDANGGVCRGKELTFMPLIRTHGPNTL